MWRPVLLRLARESDRREYSHLLATLGPALHIFDVLSAQVRDLVKARNPGRRFSSDELESLVHAHCDGADPVEFGVWAYYPWSQRLVHLLDEEEFAELRTDRNRNKITREEQAALAGKRVGIVGLSVGSAVALTICLERSCGELRLADFDRLDLSNLNRIRTGVHNLGVPKCWITAREIAEIDPYLAVTIFEEGLTRENIESFLTAGGPLDVVVEECDSLDIKVLVRQHARAHGIPVVMETSDQGMLDIERFDLEPGRPLFHGLAGDFESAALAGLTTEQKLPYVLRILGVETLSPRMRASMLEIDQTISTWPQLGSAVAQGGGAAAAAVRRINLGQSSFSGRAFLDQEPLDRCIDTREIPIERNASRVQAPCGDLLIRDLVAQATQAPSGGNAQPWRWVHDGRRLHVFVDPGRTSGLIDFDLCGSYLAIGCALESFVLAAHAAGVEVALRMFPLESESKCVATVEFAGDAVRDAEPHWRDELHAQLHLRRTQRRFTRREVLSAADLIALTDAVRSVPGCDVQWVADDGTLADVASLIGCADRLRLLHPRAHAEMLRELRWTRAEAEDTGDGIDVETLDLSPSDRAGLELCRHWPSLELVRRWRGGANLEKTSRKQIQAAAAVGLITTSSGRRRDYVTAGRAVQRMWLTATERCVAVHPMTTLPYLFARLIRGNAEGFDDEMKAELERLRVRYQRIFHVSDATGESLLFRVGFGDVECARSLRRPVDEILVTDSPSISL